MLFHGRKIRCNIKDVRTDKRKTCKGIFVLSKMLKMTTNSLPRGFGCVAAITCFARQIDTSPLTAGSTRAGYYADMAALANLQTVRTPANYSSLHSGSGVGGACAQVQSIVYVISSNLMAACAPPFSGYCLFQIRWKWAMAGELSDR